MHDQLCANRLSYLEIGNYRGEKVLHSPHFDCGQQLLEHYYSIFLGIRIDGQT